MLPVEYERFSVDFPLEHTQTGLPLGNGSLGLSVWGENGIVNITVGSTGLWDHQGGEIWREDQTYKNFCEALEKQDIDRVRELFPRAKVQPSTIPLARVVLTLPDARNVTLSLKEGLLLVSGGNTAVEISLSQTEKDITKSSPALIWRPFWKRAGLCRRRNTRTVFIRKCPMILRTGSLPPDRTMVYFSVFTAGSVPPRPLEILKI